MLADAQAVRAAVSEGWITEFVGGATTEAASLDLERTGRRGLCPSGSIRAGVDMRESVMYSRAAHSYVVQ
jgi:hypothetical protein